MFVHMYIQRYIICILHTMHTSKIFQQIKNEYLYSCIRSVKQSIGKFSCKHVDTFKHKHTHTHTHTHKSNHMVLGQLPTR